MAKVEEILSRTEKPALLIGNGINQFGGVGNKSWIDLLKTLAGQSGLRFSTDEMMEMSNTEFFDLIDLARGDGDGTKLQKTFCDLMDDWQPSKYHSKVVSWAKRHSTPLVTVNFDENLSSAIGAKRFKFGNKNITDYYPWNVYYSDKSIEDVCESFGIWHAHGMRIYPRSVRLGLTDYMGAVQRARSWVYSGEGSLRYLARSGNREWRGKDTWLNILFFKPVLVLGFGFRKDESFLRWLFLERARLYNINPSWRKSAWYVDVESNGHSYRKPFFEGLGIKYITVEDYCKIYDILEWNA